MIALQGALPFNNGVTVIGDQSYKDCEIFGPTEQTKLCSSLAPTPHSRFSLNRYWLVGIIRERLVMGRKRFHFATRKLNWNELSYGAMRNGFSSHFNIKIKMSNMFLHVCNFLTNSTLNWLRFRHGP